MNFDMSIYQWGPETRDANCAADNILASGYSNPAIDKLFVQAKGTSDEAARKNLYGQIAATLATDVPVIPLISALFARPINNSISADGRLIYTDIIYNYHWN